MTFKLDLKRNCYDNIYVVKLIANITSYFLQYYLLKCTKKNIILLSFAFHFI